jgi:hypothetical protein
MKHLCRFPKAYSYWLKFSLITRASEQTTLLIASVFSHLDNGGNGVIMTFLVFFSLYPKNYSDRDITRLALTN